MNDTAIIKEVLASLQPMIAQHGGSIEFVELKDTTVYVRLEGACSGCPSSFFTLKMGVEEALQQRLPHIQDVVAVE